MNILDELKLRGIIYQSTCLENLTNRLKSGPITAYLGCDPTAASLHIGNLFPIITLKRFEKAGHRIILLIGGATGLIGDPGGRSSERKLNPREQVAEWTAKLNKQLGQFFDFETKEKSPKLVNNYDWLQEQNIISFLRDVGKNFSVNNMLSKETVSSRLTQGISYAEFSYMVLQGYDFLHLYQEYGCELQVGGSDQWGNLTAGTELIRKITGKADAAHAITLPLLTKKDGTKFGKTSTGTIWLNKEMTSPYEFYQFWLNVGDDEVLNLLNYYTFLTPEEIAHLAQTIQTAPEKRLAQKRLAEEVTSFVHGQEALVRAQKITAAFFEDKLNKLSQVELQEVFSNLGITSITGAQDTVEMLLACQAASSKRAARELLENGAITINGQRLSTTNTLTDLNTRADNLLIVKRGKKNYYLLRLEEKV